MVVSETHCTRSRQRVVRVTTVLVGQREAERGRRVAAADHALHEVVYVAGGRGARGRHGRPVHAAHLLDAGARHRRQPVGRVGLGFVVFSFFEWAWEG